MKELSIEQKAKRYDEILARAEGANLPYYNDAIMSKVKEFVDYLLPELAESKDEKIRKGLLYVIEHHPTLPTEEAEEYIAYLEKRGEQKPVEWSEEDVLHLKSIINDIEQNAIPDNEDLNWLKSLRPQKLPQRLDIEVLKCKNGQWVLKINDKIVRGQLNGSAETIYKHFVYCSEISSQKQWKPSKESIMALRWVLNNIPYDSHKEEINGLLEQLLKLYNYGENR